MIIFSFVITIFAVIYWIFRVVVVFTYSMGIDFIATPMDINAEIIILFITLFSFIFIIKRNALGVIVYFACYGWYFGTNLYNELNSQLPNKTSIFFSIIAITLAIILLLDVFLNKNRKKIINNNSNWFYKNKKYDRNFDERADKNQYKF